MIFIGASVPEKNKRQIAFEGTAENLVQSVYTHHVDDSLTSSLVINNLFNFTIKPGDDYYKHMEDIRLPDLVQARLHYFTKRIETIC